MKPAQRDGVIVETHDLGRSSAGGSLVAAFMQCAMVGTLVEGLSIADGRYAGGL